MARQSGARSIPAGALGLAVLAAGLGGVAVGWLASGTGAGPDAADGAAAAPTAPAPAPAPPQAAPPAAAPGTTPAAPSGPGAPTPAVAPGALVAPPAAAPSATPIHPAAGATSATPAGPGSASSPPIPPGSDIVPIEPLSAADRAYDAVPMVGPDTACGKWIDQACQAAGGPGDACMLIALSGQMLPESVCEAALEPAKLAELVARVKAFRKPCIVLVDRLCKDLGPSTRACEIVREQTVRWAPDDCAARHGEIEQLMVSAMTAASREQGPDPRLFDRALELDAPGFGPLDAPVTIVLFSDFQCKYCADAAVTMMRARERYPQQLRVLFRHFPSATHAFARYAATASWAAHQQGAFWPYHDRLFQMEPNDLDFESLAALAAELALDMSRFEADRASPAADNQVNNDIDIARQFGLRGTPMAVIGRELLPDPTDLSVVVRMVERHLRLNAEKQGTP